MGVVNQSLSALRRLGLVILIAIAFVLGLATTVYLSLRSPETTVPEVVGKDRFEAEQILGNADLNFRVRATRPSNQVKANTVLFQLPRAGEVVKTGQTVAMDISRAAKEGEASEAVVNDKKLSDEKALENRNTNTSENSNENRPKRNKNTNKNSNENSNANGNTNRPWTVTSTSNANSGTAGANSNASPSTVNQNDNRRPPTPKPTPTSQNDNRENR